MVDQVDHIFRSKHSQPLQRTSPVRRKQGNRCFKPSRSMDFHSLQEVEPPSFLAKAKFKSACGCPLVSQPFQVRWQGCGALKSLWGGKLAVTSKIWELAGGRAGGCQGATRPHCPHDQKVWKCSGCDCLRSLGRGSLRLESSG